MAQHRFHTCIFFDDGEPELVCACGGRGLRVVDEETGDALVVVLRDADVVPDDARELHHELAVSA